VQIQRNTGGPRETIGGLTNYPATDGDALKHLQNRFTLDLSEPVSFVAIRVIGVPACGDNPKQAFSSRAELQSFAH
jgi:hypothetical protein